MYIIIVKLARGNYDFICWGVDLTHAFYNGINNKGESDTNDDIVGLSILSFSHDQLWLTQIGGL